MKKSTEEVIMEHAGPVAEFLGIERTEKLKDRICDIIFDQVKDDFENHRDTYIIAPYDLSFISETALKEIEPKLKKKFKDIYLKIAEDAVNRAMESMKGENNDGDKI